MLDTIHFKETRVLAEPKMNGTYSSKDKHNDVIEPVENLQHLDNKSVSTNKFSNEKIIEAINQAVAEHDAWRKSQSTKVVKAKVQKNTSFISRRSGRPHRSKSAVKSLSSKSNDDGDPEPAPPYAYLSTHEITPTPAIHLECAAPDFLGGV